jgi:hypothetical protein
MAIAQQRMYWLRFMLSITLIGLLLGCYYSPGIFYNANNLGFQGSRNEFVVMNIALIMLLLLALKSYGVLLVNAFATPEHSFQSTHSEIKHSVQTRFRVLCLVGVTCLVLFSAILSFGMHQFGGMDFSALMNAGWRYFLGQRPYVDFISVAPPIYLVGAGLVFKLFGPSWHSIVLATAILSPLLFLVQYYLLRQLGWGVIICWLFSFATQAVTFVSPAFFYYNHLTSVAATLFAIAVLGLWEKPVERQAFITFVVTAVFLSWTKPAVAGFLLAICIIPFLSTRQRAQRYIVGMTVAAVISTLLMLAFNVNPFLMLKSYLGATGRIGWHAFMQYIFACRIEAIVTYFFLIPFLFVSLVESGVYVFRADQKTLRPYFLFAGIFLLGGIIGFCVNNEFKSVDVPIIILAVLVLHHRFAHIVGLRHIIAMQIPVLIFGMLMIVGLGFTTGATRLRVKTVGMHQFYEDSYLFKVTSYPALQGMFVSLRLTILLDEIAAVLRSQDPGLIRDNAVFFGPRIEFAYPTYGIVPARGISLWWMGTGEGAPWMMDATFKAFVAANYRLCIFLKNDFTYMPKALVAYLLQNYTITQTPTLTVLTLKPSLKGHF